jgi:hypothetical protein
MQSTSSGRQIRLGPGSSPSEGVEMGFTHHTDTLEALRAFHRASSEKSCPYTLAYRQHEARQVVSLMTQKPIWFRGLTARYKCKV